MKSIFNDAYGSLFSDFLYKSTYVVGNLFELPRLVEAIQMSTHNMFL